MFEEIESAVTFLSDLLQISFNSFLVQNQRKREKSEKTVFLSKNKLKAFREQLIQELCDHYINHWFPHKPNKGQAFRCLRINHKMDPILDRVAHSVGVDDLIEHLPNELTLWIDPNEVSYRIGENGSICCIFQQNSDDKVFNDSLSDSSTLSSNSSSPVSSLDLSDNKFYLNSLLS